MALRALPGVLVTLALAIILYLASRQNLAANSTGTRPATIPASAAAWRTPVLPEAGTRESPRTRPHPWAPETTERPLPTAPRYEAEPNARRVALAPDPGSSHSGRQSPGAHSAARVFPAGRAEPTSAMAAPAADSFKAASPEPSTPITNVRNIRVGMSPARPGSVASHDALASLEEYDNCLAPGGYRVLDVPEKGIAFYGDVRGHSEKMSMRREGHSFYKNKGLTYSMGFMHEWSVDSSIGLGVDYLDYEITNRNPANRIKNDIRGFVVNGDYHGSVFGKYPIDARIFYGRTRTTGSGTIEDRENPTTPGLHLPWQEDRHNSFLYGGELKIGVPLIGTNDIKFLPEIGLRFTRVKTKAYDVRVDNVPIRLSSADSRSLTLPLTVTMKKDFLQCWGIVTPRLVVGYTREFEKGSIAARTFNSAAAGETYYQHPGLYDPNDPLFDESQKNFMQFGVGLDITSVGGWQVAADYRHHWSSKYRNDTFKLELGRCF